MKRSTPFYCIALTLFAGAALSPFRIVVFAGGALGIIVFMLATACRDYEREGDDE